MTIDSLLGKKLDEYQLERLLGHGGMARVYLAHDVRLHRHVAIKVIDSPLRTDTDYVYRFEREAQAIAKLDHPHIVSLYRYGEVDGVLYIAMQYINGSDLGTVLNQYRRDGEFIDLMETSRIIEDTCNALDYIHQQGVIHRDIKPSNIMLDTENHAIITDFGLVLLMEQGTRGEIFGSPHYIAPEQAISSAGAVPQSDLYAVGVILYEMMTGQVPFDTEHPMDLAMMHLSDPPPPPREIRPEISLEIEQVILKSLAKEPTDRYQSGHELKTAFKQAIEITVENGVSPLTQVSPRFSIHDRVLIEMENNPLPPIPAAIQRASSRPTITQTQPTLMSPPTGASKTIPSNQQKQWMFIAIGAVITILLIGLLVLFLLLNANSDDTKDNTNTSGDNSNNSGEQSIPVTVTLIETPEPPTLESVIQSTTVSSIPSTTNTTAPSITPSPSSTPTLILTATSIPSSTNTLIPSVTSQPTESIVIVELIIAKGGRDDNLFIMNTSGTDLPLAPLRLGDGIGFIAGSEWNIEFLPPNACVTAWKNGNPRNLPEIAEDCTRIDDDDNRIEREGRTRFWKDSFTIYYDEMEYGTCYEDDDICRVSIVTTSTIDSQTYAIALLIDDKNTLVVQNIGLNAFPIDLLQLGDGEQAIRTTQWRIRELTNGECIGLWEEEDIESDKIACQPSINIRVGDDPLWDEAFNVYFNGVPVQTCHLTDDDDSDDNRTQVCFVRIAN